MSGTIRILHLEDDAADARLIREQLLRSGLDASITVAGGREAFEAAIRKSEFDIVLSDYRVPRFNGLQALEYVRSVDIKVPFILVTGALGDEGAIELLHSGATDCVLKDRLAAWHRQSSVPYASMPRETSMRRCRCSCSKPTN